MRIVLTHGGFVSFYQELSEEEEDEIEHSDDSKKHKSKLKAIGAAIQKLLKKQEDDNILTKGEINAEDETSKAESKKVAEVSKIKPKNTTVEEIAHALVKAASPKHKQKNVTFETTDATEGEGKFLKNATGEAEHPSGEGESQEKSGEKILEDLGLKKKKGLPLATAVARGDKPPCICPDKGMCVSAAFLKSRLKVFCVG